MVRNDAQAGISGIEIEQQPNQIRIIIDFGAPWRVCIRRQKRSVNALALSC